MQAIKAILTGHTRGLGAAIAQELLGQRIPVLGVSRHRHAALAKQFPGALEEAEVDLADTAELGRWLAGGALQRYVVDCKTVLLINNAGTVQPIGPVETQDVMRIAQAVSLNVAAPMMLAGAIGAATSGAGDACHVRILHVSSGAARSAYAGWSIYCATKAALDHHARAVALDQTPHVRICSLAPGVIDTDMQTEIRATSAEKFPLRARFDDMKHEGLLAAPADCARQLIGFMLSPQFGQVPVADLRDQAG